eukprot:SM000043S15840  [mRNA]  locus=s43:397028:398249:- [translate_table: standard]
MGTLVRDPFYDDMPAFFGLTFAELLKAKHPTAWIEFERGHITEEELGARFFLDGRPVDFTVERWVADMGVVELSVCGAARAALKDCMVAGYTWLDGMEGMLARLCSAGYACHAFTNYPCWYQMIEAKLALSRYVAWTFISCHTGWRKPELDAYEHAAVHLGVPPSACIFIDDRWPLLPSKPQSFTQAMDYKFVD